MLSAVYPPSLPLAFSLSALLALSSSWLSVLPVLAFASPFRPLPSLAVCPALPSLLPAGALRLRPPVPKVTRRATAWDPAAVTFASAPRPGAAGQATSARSTSEPSTRAGILTTLARRSRGPAAQGLRGIAHPRKRRPTWRRAYPRSSADARPPKVVMAYCA